jgi:hypothetical protein
VVITCLKENYDSYTWVKNGEIPRGQITSFTVKQKTTYVGAHIRTGIATASIIGDNKPADNKESITYWSHGGGVYINGEYKVGGRGVEDGEDIKVVVDLVNW